jgi:hypothetical protein
LFEAKVIEQAHGLWFEHALKPDLHAWDVHHRLVIASAGLAAESPCVPRLRLADLASAGTIPGWRSTWFRISAVGLAFIFDKEGAHVHYLDCWIVCPCDRAPWPAIGRHWQRCQY